MPATSLYPVNMAPSAKDAFAEFVDSISDNIEGFPEQSKTGWVGDSNFHLDMQGVCATTSN